MQVWTSWVLQIYPPQVSFQWIYLPLVMYLWGQICLLHLPVSSKCYRLTDIVLSFLFYWSKVNLNWEGPKHHIVRDNLLVQLRSPLESTRWKSKMILQSLFWLIVKWWLILSSMHIAEHFPLNEPLLYANLMSYLAMTIFLSRLDIMIPWM